MRIKPSVLAAIACGGWLLVGCNARETAAPAARQTPSPPSRAEPATLVAGEAGATAAEATPVTIPKAPTSAATVRQAVPTGAAPAGKPPPSRRPQQSEAAPEPAREKATPIPPAPLTSAPAAPTQVASASKVVDPGGEIAVAATRAGLTRIGAEKCKICHKVQFASWVETAHAKRTPPLDCESCHGPGSEYKALAVMKDPEKAKAAGLVIPTATFCASCHARGWKDDMLRKAHAHKAS
jgi:hypothetical protein